MQGTNFIKLSAKTSCSFSWHRRLSSFFQWKKVSLVLSEKISKVNGEQSINVLVHKSATQEKLN